MKLNVPLQDKDVSNYCQTSGLITKTGILHVLRMNIHCSLTDMNINNN